jgi:hypothetical protein
MWKFLILTAGAAAAFQLAKKYNITLEDVKGLVMPLVSKYVTA